MGPENHEAIMQEFLNKNKIEDMKNKPKQNNVVEVVVSSDSTSAIKCDENRFFLIRR